MCSSLTTDYNRTNCNNTQHRTMVCFWIISDFSRISQQYLFDIPTVKYCLYWIALLILEEFSFVFRFKCYWIKIKKKYKSAFIDSHIRQISYSLVLIKLFCEKAKKRKYKYIVKMGCGIAIVKFILFVFNLVCAVSISFRI